MFADAFPRHEDRTQGVCETSRIGNPHYRDSLSPTFSKYLSCRLVDSPDGREDEDGIYRGYTDCRVISTFPWDVIRDMLNTLHVQVPER